LLTHDQQAATQGSTTSTGTQASYNNWVQPGKKLPHNGAKRLQSTARGLYPVGIHQMAPPSTHPVNKPTTHLSTPERWKAELAYLADL